MIMFFKWQLQLPFVFQIPFPNAYMAFKSKAVQKDSDTDSGLEFNISRSISAN